MQQICPSTNSRNKFILNGQKQQNLEMQNQSQESSIFDLNSNIYLNYLNQELELDEAYYKRHFDNDRFEFKTQSRRTLKNYEHYKKDALKITIKNNRKYVRMPNFPKKAVIVLKRWLINHSNFPYPNSCQKEELSRQCNLTKRQIQNWFTNARKRIWKPEIYKDSYDIFQTNKILLMKNQNPNIDCIKSQIDPDVEYKDPQRSQMNQIHQQERQSEKISEQEIYKNHQIIEKQEKLGILDLQYCQNQEIKQKEQIKYEDIEKNKIQEIVNNKNDEKLQQNNMNSKIIMIFCDKQQQEKIKQQYSNSDQVQIIDDQSEIKFSKNQNQPNNQYAKMNSQQQQQFSQQKNVQTQVNENQQQQKQSYCIVPIFTPQYCLVPIKPQYTNDKIIDSKPNNQIFNTLYNNYQPKQFMNNYLNQQQAQKIDQAIQYDLMDLEQ